MFRNLLKPNSLLAAVLVVTMSGAYCLLCCEGLFVNASGQEHCPMTKSEHCNFSKDAMAEADYSVTGESVFECCGLNFNFYVGKIEQNVYSGQTAPATSSVAPFVAPLKVASASGVGNVFYRPPPFEGPDLHIRNCVFRI